ncbi:MAG: S8 family serine peptidase [Patescibacteria group bacterium]
MSKKILLFPSVFFFFVVSVSSAQAASDSNRYLIHSSSSFSRKALGTVRHDFGDSFSVELNGFQFRMAKMLKLDIEKVPALYISAHGNGQATTAIVASDTIVDVAVLDTATSHGISVMDIIGERSRLYEVCNSRGVCFADDVAVAIRNAVHDGADVINMSFGAEDANDLMDAAINAAAREGVLLVAAAGNNGPFLDTVEYPASHPSVVSVGALTREGDVAEWSSRGDVDVWEIGEYENVAGTSIASAYFTARQVHLLEQ